MTKLVGAPALWAAGATGKGVDVAVLDTGVAPVAGLSDKIVNGPDLSLDYQERPARVGRRVRPRHAHGRDHRRP